MLKSIIISASCIFPGIACASELAFCVKDTNNAFCIESDAPVRIVPYRVTRADRNIILQGDAPSTLQGSTPSACNRMLTTNPPQVPPECRDLIAK